MEKTYCKIVLIARMGAGVATPAFCAKRAFEKQGHTVFLFTPNMWPELFDEAGAFDAAMLSRFFEVQRPDCLMLAEGMGARGLDAAASRGVAVGMLAAARSEAEASVAKSSGAPFDFAITISGRSLRLEEVDGFEGVVGACAPAVDAAYASTPIANMVAFGPGVMCLQDASPARVAFFDELVADERFKGAVRCFGAGWPERFASDPTFTHIAYSARSSAACVVFGDLGAGSQNANAPADARELKPPADALLTDEALVLVHADGAKLACVGEGLSPWRAERMDICEKDVTAAREALIAAVAEQHSGDVAFESRRLPVDSQGPFLDGSLLAALESVREQLAERELMAGLSAPRTIVSVLGYVGMGNFGDEYILATVDRRLRELVCGSSIVAVGENPLHTLRERGIYSITLQDKRVLDRVLAASSAALVIAGLLFDQGIRWSIGKAELASSMPHTDIAGIAAYVELAYMNDARPVLYGIGAGPLDVADGRSLVRLMGRLGALFLTRDETTAELIRSCRVRNEQVLALADCAFLGSASDTSFVDEWFASEGIDPASRRVVAVSLREYENAPDDFAERVATAIARVQAAHRDVVFAACILDSSDRALAERIGALLPAQAALRIFDAGERIEPVADFLSRCSAGLSMRYHASLLLGSFCKPCVGLGYLPKVVSLYEDLGQADTLLSMNADTADIIAALESVLAFDAQRAFALTNRVSELRKKSGESEGILLDAIASIAPAKRGEIPEELFLNRVVNDIAEKDRLRAQIAQERRSVEEARARCAEVERERDAARGEVEEYAHSYSYRVGSTLLTLPRKLREALSKGAKGPKES
ncbi:polysaccharide pyruvyl transferase family protein [Ellagibacter isourolithinifaciens]|uniref:polysaccharide pyruvyl transferase family protein n=1 Tax=Ellagibacter isourolithinifaciens TaxID=2137581 RepID=UPI003AF0DEA6